MIAPAVQHCHIDGGVSCKVTAYRKRLRNRYLYDGTGSWVRTAYGYSAGLYRSHKNDPVEFLGYNYGWRVTYAKMSYTQEAAVAKQWFYRDNGQSGAANIANNPDPRLGRQYYEELWQGELGGCPPAQQDTTYNRCKMATTSTTYRALTGHDSN